MTKDFTNQGVLGMDLQSVDPAAFWQIERIGIDQLYSAPWNAHIEHDEKALLRLGEQMRLYGQLTPILVRDHSTIQDGTAFEVVAGERRLRAAKLIGLPALNTHLLDDCNDRTAQHLARVTNLTTQTLDPYNETLLVLDYLTSSLAHTPGWKDLVEKHGSERHAAAWVARRNRDDFPHPTPSVCTALGITSQQLKVCLVGVFGDGSPFNLPTFVRHRIPLLDLSDELIPLVTSGRLTGPVAVIIDNHDNPAERIAIANHAAEANLSTTQVRRLLKAEEPTPEPRFGQQIHSAVTSIKHKVAEQGAALQPADKTAVLKELKELVRMLQ